MFSKDFCGVKFENLEQIWQITLKKLSLVEEEKRTKEIFLITKELYKICYGKCHKGGKERDIIINIWEEVAEVLDFLYFSTYCNFRIFTYDIWAYHVRLSLISFGKNVIIIFFHMAMSI